MMASIVEFSATSKIVVSVPQPTQAEETAKKVVIRAPDYRLYLLAHYTVQLSSGSVDYGPLSILFFRATKERRSSPVATEALNQNPAAAKRGVILLHFECPFTKAECLWRPGCQPANFCIVPVETHSYIVSLANEGLFNNKGYCCKTGSYKVEDYTSVEFTFHLDNVGVSSDLLQLYRSQEHADVTFSFGDIPEQLKAHKLILGARSEYFRAMFASATKENQTGIIDVPDFEPKVFDEGLRFLYSGEMNQVFDGKLAMALLPWADKYIIDNLKRLCIEKIKNWLEIENVSEVLALARLVNCIALKDACFRVMKNGMSEGKRWEIVVAFGDQDLTSEFGKFVDEDKAGDAAQ